MLFIINVMGFSETTQISNHSAGYVPMHFQIFMA